MGITNFPIETVVVELGASASELHLAPQGDPLGSYTLVTKQGPGTLYLNGLEFMVGQALTLGEIGALTYGPAEQLGALQLQFLFDDGTTAAVYNAVIVVAPSINGTYFGTPDRDYLDGGGGNDFINGLAGADLMLGGTGNDQFVVENRQDIASELGGTGRDLVRASINFNLASANAKGSIEDLLLFGAATLGTGNGLQNTITGNARGNLLDGGAATDILRGMAGNDVLIGGAGKDVLTGGANNDIFRFLSKAHSPAGGLADVITDFDDFGDDRIDVSALFGSRMQFIGADLFSKPGQVRINDVSGPDVVVEVNSIGKTGADFAIRLAATSFASMTAADFIL